MKFTMFTILVMLGCVPLNADEKTPGMYELDAGPQKQCKLDIARFRMWIDPDQKKVNGVFLFVPGRNGDGRGVVNQKNYKELAKKWGFALMGCNLVSEKGKKDFYQLDREGETAGLLNWAIAEFAKTTKKKELRKVPVFGFGISAGGNVVSQYSGHCHEHTIGCVSYIPTIGPGWPVADDKKKVPLLIAVGARDGFIAQSDRFWKSTSSGSVWTLAKHKDLGHEAGPAQQLGMIYAEAILKLRMTKNQKGEFTSELKNIKIEDGWVGNLENYSVSKINKENKPGKDKLSKIPSGFVWLPDEKTAKAWSKYLTTRILCDR